MKTLHRRTFLRGSGTVAVALPFLNMMRPTKAQASEAVAPRRMVLLTTPNGTIADLWFPDMSQIGKSDFKLSPILSPLEPHKKDITVLLGVDNRVERSGHLKGMCSLYTGRKALQNGTNNTASGPSLDQVVAKLLSQNTATRTPFSSLVLGTTTEYTRATSTTSYIDKRTPMPKMAGAKAMFEQIFGLTTGQNERLTAMRRSILDDVSEDLRAIKRRAGRRDLERLELHLNSIREVELQLQRTANADELKGFMPGMTNDHNRALDEMIPQMFDVLALAFATDMTRSVNFNIRTEGATSAYTFGWLGIGPEDDPYDGDNRADPVALNHHAMSHNEHTPTNRSNLAAVGKFFVGEWAKFIEKLKGLKEVDDSSVFDNTVMVHSSPIARGGPHSCNDLPFLLMGGAGGRLKTGQFLNLRPDGSTDFGKPEEDPALHVHGWAKFRGVSHTNVLLTVLHAMGFEDQTSFGDPEFCDGPISALLA